MDVAEQSRRIGPITLVPGTTPAQVGIFLVVVTTAMVMFFFLPVVQPYVFSEVMHVPTAQQGRLTGYLQMVQFGAVALFIVPVGSLSDRWGRKPVLILGLVGFIITLVLLPFCAAVIAMVAVRFFFGLASTGHTAGGATMMVDFPTNASRGKFIALMLVVQSLIGALLTGWLLPQTPAWLIAHGFARADALKYSLWGLAILGVCGVVVAVCALKAPPTHQAVDSSRAGFKGILKSAREVLALSKSDPTFGLVVLIAFVIRSDYFVSQSFISVWVMNAAKLHGVDAPAALKTVGLMQVILLVSLSVTPFLFGWIADRFNRVAFLIASLVFAAGAFAATMLVHDVTSIGMMVVVALIGIAETAQTVASQAVFGERAPPALRGSAMGFLVLMGTISVIVVSFVAGLLFDKMGFTAPFVFLSGLNVVFAIGATVLVTRRRNRDRRGVAAAAG